MSKLCIGQAINRHCHLQRDSKTYLVSSTTRNVFSIKTQFSECSSVKKYTQPTPFCILHYCCISLYECMSHIYIVLQRRMKPSFMKVKLFCKIGFPSSFHCLIKSSFNLDFQALILGHLCLDDFNELESKF